jgi:hypothetical protein
MSKDKKIQSIDEKISIIASAAKEWDTLSKEERDIYKKRFISQYRSANSDLLSAMSLTEQEHNIHNNCRPREEYIREATGAGLSDSTIRRYLRKSGEVKQRRK